MNFDNKIVAPCVNPSANQGGRPACGADDGPPAEPRDCSDPVFAAANPDLCLTAPRLVVKPSYSIREAGKSVDYEAFLWANGEETLLEEGVTWSLSNPIVAVLNSDGRATAVAEGITTVSATYGTLTGYAQLEVVASCQANTFVLAFDMSRSMLAAFSTTYAHRFSAAKEYASQLVRDMDLTKDKVAIVRFAETGEVTLEETDDETVALEAIRVLAPTHDLPAYSSLLAGIQTSLGVEVTNRRVVVLFSDGEQNIPGEPVAAADAARGDAIFFGVALRSAGEEFRRIHRVSNGGMFINATKENEGSVRGWLAGLQSYVCSGNCEPPGDVIVGSGVLNFTNFLQWDLESGNVDLIGKNEGGPEVFDFLPGNGLYLDGAGSTDGSGSANFAVLITKDRFVLEEGHEYRLSIDVAGNQRQDRSPDVTVIEIIGPDDTVVESKTISVTDFLQPFLTYELEFTAEAGYSGGIGCKIRIRQDSIPAGGITVIGNLWDNVLLEDVTDGITLFEDTFDGDNEQVISPCGQSVYGSQYSTYCYGYGCLENAIPEQTEDISPHPGMESA